MSARSLPWRSRRIYLFLHDYIGEHGFCPSYKEIAEAVDLSSVSTVNYQMRQLALWGYIEREPWRPRAVRLLVPPEEL